MILSQKLISSYTSRLCNLTHDITVTKLFFIGDISFLFMGFSEFFLIIRNLYMKIAAIILDYIFSISEYFLFKIIRDFISLNWT